ncbi:DUF6118 family protein [Sphingomonadaceae bacterium G21617-S1]|nr:DUF6118 family protein [Sphingomonadaceae bacterium G21617-S1]
MESTDIDDREPTGEADPATQAFARLEGEMALVRRAVEHLAAEKAEIVVPDYSRTLGEMAKRLGAVLAGLDAVAEKPALQLTPEGLVARIEAAAQGARRADHTALAEARERFDLGSQAMREIAGKAHSSREQRRRLIWAADGGLLAGILLWSFLPGTIARAMPDSWLLPERIATRVLGAPSPWEAGTRLMSTGSPRAWSDLVQAADMQRDNREAIDLCHNAAGKAAKPVRCSIQIKPTLR